MTKLENPVVIEYFTRTLLGTHVANCHNSELTTLSLFRTHPVGNVD